jgi:hypothetical protein
MSSLIKLNNGAYVLDFTSISDAVALSRVLQDTQDGKSGPSFLASSGTTLLLAPSIVFTQTAKSSSPYKVGFLTAIGEGGILGLRKAEVGRRAIEETDYTAILKYEEALLNMMTQWDIDEPDGEHQIFNDDEAKILRDLCKWTVPHGMSDEESKVIFQALSRAILDTGIHKQDISLRIGTSAEISTLREWLRADTSKVEEWLANERS